MKKNSLSRGVKSKQWLASAVYSWRKTPEHVLSKPEEKLFPPSQVAFVLRLQLFWGLKKFGVIHDSPQCIPSDTFSMPILGLFIEWSSALYLGFWSLSSSQESSFPSPGFPKSCWGWQLPLSDPSFAEWRANRCGCLYLVYIVSCLFFRGCACHWLAL